MDHEIGEALRGICAAFAIDLGVLWQWSAAAPDSVERAHFCRAAEGPRSAEPVLPQPFPWTWQEMLAGRAVVVSALEELPSEAAADRELYRAHGIESILCLPLAVGREPPVGALSFNALRRQRKWGEPMVERLRLVAQTLTNALAWSRHELRRKETEDRLAAGAELANLAFYEVNFREVTVWFDDRFRDLCGLPGDRQKGLQALEFWLEHLHPEDRRRVLDMRQKLHERRLDRATIEYRFLHPTRGERWLHHTGRVSRLDASGRAAVTFGVLRDITTQKQAEEELREFGHRLIRAQEAERALLARELHDDVTQRLAVLAITAGRAELATPDGEQAEAMRTIREGLVRLSEDIHTLASQLHPSVLKELGLVEALRAEGERMSRQSRIGFSVDLDPPPAALGEDAALCLFRVAQEALNNVIRHAAASVATVTLRRVDDGLLLAVRDDGVGFDPESTTARRSLGLASMRERAQLVNGRLRVETAPGRGTAIDLWVPVETGAR